jgi:hypothetical protein
MTTQLSATDTPSVLPDLPHYPTSDTELLDAFSRTVVGVAQLMNNAVVQIRVEKNQPLNQNRRRFDQPVGSIDDMHRYLTEKQINKRLLLTVFRRNAVVKVTVIPSEIK